jgi:Dioxygenases related to 2-nitropropane dioxygenase
MSLIQDLGIQQPLIVAPMAGGPTTPELVIASCEAGAMGSMGAAYMTSDAIRDFAAKVRAGTNKPFSINLFVSHPQPTVTDEMLKRAVAATQKYRDQLHLPVPTLAPPYEENFDMQIEEVLKIKPRALSFIFGIPHRKYLTAAKAAGIHLIGTATSPQEAQALDQAGFDSVILQGIESGGHRGIFDPSASDPAMTVFELLKQTRSIVQIPLIAAGGIMTREDIQKCISLGADAVQMGTAFLAVKEAGTSEVYRKKLLESSIRKTATTRVFSGRLARGIVNRFMEEMTDPLAILPFQAQNKFTRDIRNASTKAGSPDFLSLWSGTGEGALWTGTTAELIANLMKGV